MLYVEIMKLCTSLSQAYRFINIAKLYDNETNRCERTGVRLEAMETGCGWSRSLLFFSLNISSSKN